MVHNVDSTIEYYERIGFETVIKSVEDSPAYWAFVKKDNVELYFQSKDSLTQEFPELKGFEYGGAMTLWFQVDNIRQWYRRLSDKSHIIRPLGITDYNGANEFVIRDLNGFILHFSDFDLNAEIEKRKIK
ncbi:MAG: hypothetical protein HRT74_06010 [Flavobacteriales bacterium]|nr:hypothetical protein [Flavobacteriales bacterium]